MAIAAFVALGAARAESPFPRADGETALTDAQLLGKKLFEDTRLSEPAGLACRSCHDPGHAFQGVNGSPIPAVALGSRPGQFGTRKPPSLMYKTYSPAFGFYKGDDVGKQGSQPKGGQFWDGRALSLADQVTSPLLEPTEMNNPSVAALVEKVRKAPYRGLVDAVIGGRGLNDPDAAIEKLGSAIFAYEASARFAPFASKFDDWLRGSAALTAQETRGYALFIDPKSGNCVACHAGKPGSKDPADWIFSDFTYDALGVPRNPSIPANADPSQVDLGLCRRPRLVTLLPNGVALDSLCGAFKVPSLRNVAVTAPYFHNGAIADLRDAVAFHATRDTDPARWYPKRADGAADAFNDLPDAFKANVNRHEVPYDRERGQKPRLSEADVDAITAFLGTLTDKGMR